MPLLGNSCHQLHIRRFSAGFTAKSIFLFYLRSRSGATVDKPVCRSDRRVRFQRLAQVIRSRSALLSLLQPLQFSDDRVEIGGQAVAGELGIEQVGIGDDGRAAAA